MADKCKLCEIYRKMCDVYRETCFSQRNLYKLACHNNLKLKRQSIVWKHNNSPVKKKFQVQQSVKKVMLSVFWNRKEPIPIDFFENGETKLCFLLPIPKVKLTLFIE